jgi:RNA polymerase sigma factor (sigma-70 family)
MANNERIEKELQLAGMEYRALFNSNRELWQQLKDGNIQAMGELFSRNHNYLVAYGLKIIPSREIVFDSIQDIFLTIWNSRENLSDVCNVVSYLFKALRNELLRRMRQEARFSPLTESKVVEGIDLSFSYEDIILQKETSKEIHQFVLQALNKLGARQKEAIFLKFYFGMSNSEIGEVMDLQDQSVRNTIHEALKILKQITTISIS